MTYKEYLFNCGYSFSDAQYISNNMTVGDNHEIITTNSYFIFIL